MIIPFWLIVETALDKEASPKRKRIVFGKFFAGGIALAVVFAPQLAAWNSLHGVLEPYLLGDISYGGGEALSFQRARLLQRFSFWGESGTVLFRAHLGSRSSRARLYFFFATDVFAGPCLAAAFFIHRRSRRHGARLIFRPTLPSAGASTAGDRPGGGGRTGASFSRDRFGSPGPPLRLGYFY